MADNMRLLDDMIGPAANQVDAKPHNPQLDPSFESIAIDQVARARTHSMCPDKLRVNMAVIQPDEMKISIDMSNHSFPRLDAELE